MITLAVDINNDLVIGPDGLLSFARDVEAVSQDAAHYGKTLRNEMLHEYDLGIPFFMVAFGANVTIQQYEAATKQRLLQTPGVTGIRQFDVVQEGDILKYTATIETIYGLSEVNG